MPKEEAMTKRILAWLLAVLALCADMYELRQATTTSLQVNPTTLQILSQHSVALL